MRYNLMSDAIAERLAHPSVAIRFRGFCVFVNEVKNMAITLLFAATGFAVACRRVLKLSRTLKLTEWGATL